MESDPPPPLSGPGPGAAVFAAPSIEGATLALRALLRDGGPEVRASRQCAVAIDVLDRDHVLIQRSIAHDDVPPPVRDALRELVDRHVRRFAAAQRIDPSAAASFAHPSARRDRGGAAGASDPYRGGFVPNGEFAGFPCGFASETARQRTSRLRDGLKGAGDLEVRHYAVPFLLVTIARDHVLAAREVESAVVMRAEDGTYVYSMTSRGQRSLTLR
jgi:hypothetical protein